MFSGSHVHSACLLTRRFDMDALEVYTRDMVQSMVLPWLEGLSVTPAGAGLIREALLTKSAVPGECRLLYTVFMANRILPALPFVCCLCASALDRVLSCGSNRQQRKFCILE